MSAAVLEQLRLVFIPFVQESAVRGFTVAETRGQLAALLVICTGLTRAQALCVARVAV